MKRKRMLFIIGILLITLVGCGKQEIGKSSEETYDINVIEASTEKETEVVVAIVETPTEIQTEVPTAAVIEAPAEAVVSTPIVVAPTEAPAAVVKPTEAAVSTPIVETPTVAPVVTNGVVYGYYTNCTTDGLIEIKTEYGKHLPYEYFSLSRDYGPGLYCIAYADDISLCGHSGRGGLILTSLTTTIQTFSDYGKTNGGNGVVGVTLSNFGYYNGRLVCVVYTGSK